jgi:hypothetical protein
MWRSTLVPRSLRVALSILIGLALSSPAGSALAWPDAGGFEAESTPAVRAPTVAAWREGNANPHELDDWPAGSLVATSTGVEVPQLLECGPPSDADTAEAPASAIVIGRAMPDSWLLCYVWRGVEFLDYHPDRFGEVRRTAFEGYPVECWNAEVAGSLPDRVTEGLIAEVFAFNRGYEQYVRFTYRIHLDGDYINNCAQEILPEILPLTLASCIEVGVNPSAVADPQDARVKKLQQEADEVIKKGEEALKKAKDEEANAKTDAAKATARKKANAAAKATEKASKAKANAAKNPDQASKDLEEARNDLGRLDEIAGARDRIKALGFADKQIDAMLAELNALASQCGDGGIPQRAYASLAGKAITTKPGLSEEEQQQQGRKLGADLKDLFKAEGK